MVEEFLLLAALGGLGVALIAGPLGSFVVWRRMAYFGDTLAHSGLLGVALGFLLHVQPVIGLAVTTASIALLLYSLDKQKFLPTDTLLGILSHGSLSLGLIVIALMDWLRVDLNGLLFGDLLALSPTDVAQIFAVSALALGIMAYIWRPLLMVTLSVDLAKAEGIKAERIQLIYLLVMAATIAIAMKVVGILLITSLLIIPAAAARQMAKTPESMAVTASVIGMISVLGGLALSYYWDSPSGPSIVVVACLLFALASLLFRRHRI